MVKGNNHVFYMSTAKDNFRKYWAYYIVGSLLLCSLIFVLIKQENIYITIHDNLDSNIGYLKLLKDSGEFFNYNGTVNVLGGIGRMSMASMLNIYNIFYYFLPTFWAYVVTSYLKIIFSITGFYFISRQTGFDKSENYNLSVFIGFIFGITPSFPPIFGFSTLPLLLALLISIYNKPTIWKYVLLLLYPSTSSLFTFGAFIIGYIILFSLLELIIKHKVSLSMFVSIIVLLIGYVIVDYNTLHVLMASESIRAGELYTDYSVINVFIRAIEAFTIGQYHSGHSYIVYTAPFCGIYFLFLNRDYIISKEYRKIFYDPFNLFVLWSVFNSLCVGLDEYAPLRIFLGKLISFSIGYQFDRTLWFSSFAMCTATLIALGRLYEKKKYKIISLVNVVAMLSVIFFYETYNDLYRNLKFQIAYPLLGRTTEELTYKEFYSEDLFTEIKKDINYRDEYSVAYGFHPVVLSYNDISTLDGYISYYGADYKRLFRKIVAPELAVDEEHRKYFDEWGGRAYIFSNEINYVPTKTFFEKANILIDIEAFKDLGGKYVFSRVQISNSQGIGLKYIQKYSSSDSPYTIYVYSAE